MPGQFILGVGGWERLREAREYWPSQLIRGPFKLDHADPEPPGVPGTADRGALAPLVATKTRSGLTAAAHLFGYGFARG